MKLLVTGLKNVEDSWQLGCITRFPSLCYARKEFFFGILPGSLFKAKLAS